MDAPASRITGSSMLERSASVKGAYEALRQELAGTIVGQDDVVLKVEEGRIRFAKASVSGVLRSSTTKPESTIIEPKPEAASVNA